MKKKIRAPSLAKYHRNLSESGSHGPFQQPRNRVTAIELIAIMLASSPRKNSPHFMLEYSVWNPATSSASASGRSNGARLVSAKAVMMKMMKASGCWTTNHTRSCAWTISTSDSDPASSRTPTVDRPIASSYEIIWAEERSPPSSAYLLFDDQPASVIAYTPMLDMARNSSRPTLMSVTVKAGPTGITENVTTAGIAASRAAKWNTTWLTPAGTNSSLKNSLSTSAMGCRSPKGPTRLGPVRAWMCPAILRSAKVR